MTPFKKYPSCKHAKDGSTVIVNSEAEEAKAKAEGFKDSPADFEEKAKPKAETPAAGDETPVGATSDNPEGGGDMSEAAPAKPASGKKSGGKGGGKKKGAKAETPAAEEA